MRLPLVAKFLQTVPRYKESGDRKQCQLKCCFCGDSNKSDHGHLSIKLDIDKGSPIVYKCFRAECQRSGILTTEILQQLGCNDMNTLLELSKYNQTVSKSLDKSFNDKSNKNYTLVNLDIKSNMDKLAYINARLGTQFDTNDLKQFKIQLGLYEFLNVNYINHLSFSKSFCDLLDQYTIGFLSMYSDYLICRDITKNLRTGNRYTMYRASGKPDPNDMKLYCIPTEIDLIDPTPAEIHIAEGTFSILGAYLHTGIGHEQRNSIWLANCGSEFNNTLMHVVKQYGFLTIILHIWSDSEIKMEKYEKLVRSLTGRVRIKAMFVHYNTKADDFGHGPKNIKTSTIQLI